MNHCGIELMDVIDSNHGQFTNITTTHLLKEAKLEVKQNACVG